MWVQFPWNPEVKFKIIRSGISGYRNHLLNQQSASMVRALQVKLREEGITLEQAIEGDLDLDATMRSVLVADVDIDTLSTAGNAEAVAKYLVAEVEGLKDLDSGHPVKWDAEKGTQILADHPRFQTWILEESAELEEQYQAVVAVSVKNSQASSGGEVPDQPANPS
jgi:hypothetical protein